MTRAPAAADTIGAARDRRLGARLAAPAHQLAVVVPTRNEADTIAEFTRRTLAALHAWGGSFEVVVVDDSDDDTPARIARIADDGLPVRCIHRVGAERTGGLGGALMQGFADTDSRVVVVMDADLQHPPEALPSLLAPLRDVRIDIVVASRYVDGGSAAGLDGQWRDAASLVARAVVHAALPATRSVTDPCGGFFAVRRELLTGVHLRPDGFKILVEILARTPWSSISEVPYGFGARAGGISNFGPREVVRFVRHVGRLALAPGRDRLPDNGLGRAAGGRAAVSAAPVLPASPSAPGTGLRARRGFVRLRAVPASRWFTWCALLGYLVFQIVTALTLRNGPFLDEGIYITAGERTLQGRGISDGYLGWFAGSLLWPSLAGGAFSLGGLPATRVLASVIVTVGFAGAARATRNLYGDAAAGFGVAMVLTGGTALQLGHLGVYDVVALAGLGVALAAVTDLHRTGHRGWIVLAALAMAVAVLGKYPALAFVPALGCVLVLLRRRAGAVDAALLAAIFSAVMLMFFLPWRHQLAYFLQWRVTNNPSFGVTRAMVVSEQMLYGAPFVAAALLGLLVAPRGRRGIALVLALTMLLFPAYHIVTANSVGAAKHLLLGLTVATPVIGVGLARLAAHHWFRRAVVLLGIVALATVGLDQMHRLDHGWVDAGPGGHYLAEHVVPGDTLLVTNAWQVLPYLYGHGVDDPSAVTDSYGSTHASPAIDICRQDWMVNTTNDNAWPDDVLDQMRACGTFVEVFRSSSTLTNLSRDLRYVTYQGEFVVYENTKPRA